MRLKTTKAVGRGSPSDVRNVPLVPFQSSAESRSGNREEPVFGLVPVVDAKNHPLSPCKSSVIRRLIRIGSATPFFKKGIFAIRLNKVAKDTNVKRIVMSIDPGSKRTGITVATEENVILNIQCNAPDWVKGKVETRKNYRRSRRSRNTPYRKCRFNRDIGCIPPSTKARWQAHLRILDQLRKIIPITDIVIEDIKAKTRKGSKKWNTSFSPLEVGKTYFESEIQKRELKLYKFQGFETKEHRDYRGFKKSSNKLEKKWETHCVDSHCLSEMFFGDLEPVKKMYLLNFFRFNRRELHQGYHNGIRKLYGSTRSMGINRGTLVNHSKYRLSYVGGNSKGVISLHNVETGKRLSQNVKKSNLIILTKQSWRISNSSPT